MAVSTTFRILATVSSLLYFLSQSPLLVTAALAKPRIVCSTGSQTPPVPSQIFDPVSLECENCPEFTERDESGLNCLCLPGHRLTRNSGGSQVQCVPCPLNQVTSDDGWSCVDCSNANGLVSLTSECSVCADNQVSADRALDGSFLTGSTGNAQSRCLTCQATTAPNSDATRCERCTNIVGTAGGSSCVCSGELTGGFCFTTAQLPLSNQISYRLLLTNDAETEVSGYVQEHLRAAFALCKAPGTATSTSLLPNMTSCQQLANLCAADYTSINRPICQLYRRRSDILGNVVNVQLLTIEDWPDNLPWLYYANDGSSLLGQTEVTTEFTFVEDHITSQLRFKVAKFALNGTYLGMEDIRNGQLQLCADTLTRLNSAWVFGTAYSQSCPLNVYELLDRNIYETIFYDLYLEYSNSQGKQLFPVPVLITNYRNGEGAVNSEGDQSKWQFTRRFFLVDNEMFYDAAGDATIVRYVEQMDFKLKLLENGGGKIYTPYVSLTYAHKRKGDVNVNDTVGTSFSVSYEMDSNKYSKDMEIALSVMGCLAAVYAAVMSWGWARRAGNASFCLVIIKFFLFTCGTLSNCFLLVLTFSALWWLVFFKRQDVVYLLPVTDAQEIFFRNFLIVAMVLKFVDVIHMFVVQNSIDIFLIDWERPKVINKDHTAQGQPEKPTEASVSIWRTYFVANEWNEIQTARKICPLFQIICTIFFLQFVGFEFISTKDSVTSFKVDPSVYRAQDSPMFRFALMSIIWIVLAILQWIFFTFIWERFVDDNVRQFVDLCSMANVSVFIMEYRQYGYYIHGRSPHGIADTGMKEMFQQLKREQESLCGHRGLVPNTEAQTFRMALPIKLREKYDEVLRPLNDRQRHVAQREMAVAYDKFSKYNPHLPHAQPTFWAQQLEDKLQATRGQGGEGDKFQQAVSAYGKINRFLSEFLDHSLKELDYAVKDKMFFESVLDAEFEQVTDKGQFYNDNGHSFDQCLFYGHELTLTAFEILLFGFVDSVAGGSFTLAAVVTYFTGMFLKLIREAWGRKNLANKTLVDERFLI